MIDEKRLQAGRDLDILVATKVMGLIVEKQSEYSYWTRRTEWTPSTGEYSESLKPYSTSIAAAWEVVGALEAKECVVTVGRRIFPTGVSPWEVVVSRRLSHESFDHSRASADTAPHAICLAALKAVGSIDR